MGSGNGDQLREFEHLWTTERAEWVLIGRSRDGGLLPFHLPTRSALLIDENDDVARAVAERMADAGVPIVSAVPPE